MAEGKVLIEVKMEDGSVAKGVADINGLMDEAGKSSEGFGSKLKNALSLGAIGGLAYKAIDQVVQGVMNLSGEVIESSDAIDKFKSTMTAAGKGSAEIDKLSKASQDYANKTVYDLKTVLNTAAQLGANGVKDYGQLVQAAGNMNAVFGGTADTFQSVAMVMTQTAGAGKLTTENWNQLSDAIPGASMKLQDAMKKNGAFTGNFRDAMADGQITADEFNKAIMDLGMTDAAKQAAESTTTFEGAMGNLQASFVTVGTNFLNKLKVPITTGMSEIANAVPVAADAIGRFFDKIVQAGQNSGVFAVLADQVKSFNWTALFSPFKTAMQNATKGVKWDTGGFTYALKNMIPQAQSVAAGLSAAFAPVAGGLEKMGANLNNALQPFFAWLGSFDFASFLEPLQSIGTTIGDVLGSLDFSGIQALGEAILPALQSGFQAFMNVAGPAINGVVTAFGNLWNAAQPIVAIVAQNLAPTLQILGAYLGGVFSSVLSGISMAFNFVAGALKFLQPLIGALSQAFQAIAPVLTVVAEWVGKLAGMFGGLGGVTNELKSIVSNAWNGIHSAVQVAGDGISAIIGILKGVFSAFGKSGSGLKAALKGAWDGIVGVIRVAKTTISDVIGSIKSIFQGLGHISLKGAGEAIMNGFVGGLKAVWEAGKKFIGGIGDWIKKHKGPISYDAKLLIPAGNAIMGGLNQGLVRAFGTVKKNVGSMTGDILATVNAAKLSDRLSAMVPEATVNLGTAASLSGARAAIAGQYSAAAPVGAAAATEDAGSQELVINVAANIDGQRLTDHMAEPIRVKIAKTNQRNNRLKGVLI